MDTHTHIRKEMEKKSLFPVFHCSVIVREGERKKKSMSLSAWVRAFPIYVASQPGHFLVRHWERNGCPWLLEWEDRLYGQHWVYVIPPAVRGNNRHLVFSLSLSLSSPMKYDDLNCNLPDDWQRDNDARSKWLFISKKSKEMKDSFRYIFFVIFWRIFIFFGKTT